MNKLLPHFVKLLFGVFILGVVAAVMFYSFQGLGKIFPNDLMGQLFGMTLFDVATIVWFYVFIGACASTMQYVFSGIGFLLGLSGTLGLVSIEVGLSSGMLAAGTMQKPLTYIFIAALIGHLILIYAHHASEPNISAKISLGVDKANIIDQAQKEATQTLIKNMPQLSAPIAARLVREVMKDLNLEPQRGAVLDLPALAVVDNQTANDSVGKLGVMDFLKGLWSKAPAQPRTYEQTAAAAAAPQPKPAANKTVVQKSTWVFDNTNTDDPLDRAREVPVEQGDEEFWAQANRDNATKLEARQAEDKPGGEDVRFRA